MLSRAHAAHDLATHRGLRAGTLCLLYFCQGFPWGFATIALIATLSAAGHGKADTATVAALAILPWTFKFFYAPMIDTYRVPSLGLRRPWIIFAQAGMAVTLMVVVLSGELTSASTLQFIAWAFFVHNCFAALQDVATDSLAVDLLTDAERGRVNALMWASKNFGIAVGGAGMAWLVVATSLETAVLVQSLMICAVLVLLIQIPERRGEKKFPWSAGVAMAVNARMQRSLGKTFSELKRALSTRTTFSLALFASLYIVGEGLFDPLVAEMFVQKLGWSVEAYSSMAGISGVTTNVLGAILGGLLSDRFGRRRVCTLAMIATSGVFFAYALTSAYWELTAYPHYLLYPIFKGLVAMAAVSFFSLAMKVSWTKAAATQFTLYMALGNVGYAVGAKLNTWLAWVFGAEPSYEQFFLVMAVLPLLPLILLLGMNPDRIVQQRQAESAQ